MTTAHDYRLILACRLSGQMAAAQWEAHLSDPLFWLWLDRDTAKTPRVGATRDE
ncbi:hypothetical protein [Sphingobium sp. DC-2]|uniref:hypothetical protein n=1 Tax=Sphingobium sp. DC-2 TaxID=1303256 RepID=UPI000A7587FE|nr:hypothetical protein [Sphingobium sp. DC-2]